MDILRRDGVDNEEETVENLAHIVKPAHVQQVGQHKAQEKEARAQPNLRLKGQLFHQNASFSLSL